METVLYIIGALWIILGTFTVLYTDRSRAWSAALIGAVPMKALAFIPILSGVLLMLSAPWSHSFWLVEAVGALAVLKGLLLLLLPMGEHGRSLVSWWQEKASEVTWRFAGLIGVILGVFLVLRL
jgi:hypothetical protein